MRTPRQILDPDMFQGSLNASRYFEGWYYKLVDAEERHTYAIIPGIALDRTQNTSHAFIQILDGISGQYHYLKYPVGDFRWSHKRFAVAVGPNTFSAQHLILTINQPEISIKGRLEFSDLAPWPCSAFAPGVMGPFSYLPLMETRHGLVSMNHQISGNLEVDGTSRDFTGGRGYTEKDSGRSFPSAYIWLQSNHFTKEPTSIMAAIATIPYLGLNFRGFFVILWLAGRWYKFATYTGARLLKLKAEGTHLSFAVSTRTHLLEIVARKIKGSAMKSPSLGSMSGRIRESLISRVWYRLYEKQGSAWQLKSSDEGRNAGLEIENDSGRL